MRDWYSDTGGFSACVSSTGLSRTQQYVDHSVVSSYDGSGMYPEAPRLGYMRDNPAERYLTELSQFANSVYLILDRAGDPIASADSGLYSAHKALRSETDGLVANAQPVISKISAAAADIQAKQRTLLIWLSRGDHLDLGFSNTLAEVVELVGDARKDAQAIRASYLDLLSLVRYMSLCIQVTQDQYIIARLSDEGEGQPEGNQQEQELPLVSNLDFAMGCMDQLCSMMEDCSDFWLHVHQEELFLKAIQKDTQKVLKNYVAKDGLPISELTAQLFKRMDDFQADRHRVGTQASAAQPSGHSQQHSQLYNYMPHRDGSALTTASILGESTYNQTGYHESFPAGMMT